MGVARSFVVHGATERGDKDTYRVQGDVQVLASAVAKVRSLSLGDGALGSDDGAVDLGLGGGVSTLAGDTGGAEAGEGLCRGDGGEAEDNDVVGVHLVGWGFFIGLG